MTTALRRIKLSALHAARGSGVFRLFRDSGRRGRQLLILCYHGISIDDEHEWAPGLYMSPEAFGARLEILERGRYNVLPLGEAVRRLYDGTLPPRSVAITFDDGTYDFHARAWPLLREYEHAVTVYLTTYYCERNLPVFPLALSYLLWKRRDARIAFPLSRDLELAIDTASAEGRRSAQNDIQRHVQDEGYSTLEKDALLATLADALGADYGALRRRRILHLLTPSEVRELDTAGVDIQLHTHRHRSPPDRNRYCAEVSENRTRIAAMTGKQPNHFCYPSGACLPDFPVWLNAEGVVSATTCVAGMATGASDPLRLPRLLDHADTTPLEFEAWLSGLGSLLPRRAVAATTVDADGRPVIGRRATVPATTDPRARGMTVAAPFGDLVGGPRG